MSSIERTSPSVPPEEPFPPAPKRGFGVPDEPPSAPPDPTHRFVTLLATIGLFAAAFATWGTSILLPITGLVAVAGFAMILALIIAALAASRASTLYRVDIVLLITGVALLCVWAASLVRIKPAYGTDEAAFTQAAASLLLHGHDPYGADLGYALSEFRVPTQFWTLLMNGHVVTGFGYPPAAALVVAAYIEVFGSSQSMMVVDVLALAVTTVMMFFMLPRRWRPLALLVTVGLPVLEGFATSGDVAVVMVVFLLFTAYRWTEITADGNLGRRDWLSAICLGVAAAASPIAWFVVPFLLTAIYLLRAADFGPRRAARLVARYAAIGGGVFLALNLPFIVMGPGSWLKGVAAPLIQDAIPYGQGLVSLTLFYHVGGGAIHLFTLAAVAAYLGALVVFILNFKTLGRACFVLAIVPLFFASRSLGEYFTVMLPVWVISFVAIDQDSFSRIHPHRWSSLAARRASYIVPLAPAALLLIVALATPAPLSLNILSVSSASRRTTLWQITTRVHNNSGETLTPHFATNSNGLASNFWHQVAGPPSLAPGATAMYTIDAPNAGSQPSGDAPLRLVAMTHSPDTFSSSGAYTAYRFSVELEPHYIIRKVAAGETLHISAQLTESFGNPIHAAGLTIGLAQSAYVHGGDSTPMAQINGGPPGHSPAYAVTGPRGVANFEVVNDAPSPDGLPIQFVAFIQHRDGRLRSRYGFSEYVTIFWRRP